MPGGRARALDRSSDQRDQRLEKLFTRKNRILGIIERLGERATATHKRINLGRAPTGLRSKSRLSNNVTVTRAFTAIHPACSHAGRSPF